MTDPSETSDGEDDIPLNIAGHEDREPPGESADGLFSDGDDESESEADRGDDGRGGADDDELDDGVAEDAEVNDSEVDDDADTDDEDDAPEPVEVLVDLAENGEIDPWDIDIVAVTDKFLDRLDEGDLRTSGRALFYASVLLRMKGDAMLADDDEEEPEPDPWEQAMVADEPVDGPDPFAALETEMDRRLERKRARGMPQTRTNSCAISGKPSGTTGGKNTASTTPATRPRATSVGPRNWTTGAATTCGWTTSPRPRT
jgi:segregation and condensation protein A